MTEERAGLPIIGFNDLEALELWLGAQPANSPGLWIKLAKAGSGIPSVTKAEAIDAALCHGWIDGQLDKYDDVSWLIRFTPRKVRSKWSQVNRARSEDLMAAGRVHSRGLAQIEAARKQGPGASRSSSSTRSEPRGRSLLRNSDRSQSLRDPLPDRNGEEARNASA
jgi:uncharacterized protein YdeI (YjbR/CyaY-like superfamily)